MAETILPTAAPSVFRKLVQDNRCIDLNARFEKSAI